MSHCYLCGSNTHHNRPGSVRDNPGLQVLECDGCGLVFLSSEDHIRPGHYEESGMHGGEPAPIAQWIRETEHDDERRFRFLQPRLVGQSVLDFGCGTGEFLLKARRLAAIARGIEPELRLQEHFHSQNLTVWTSLDDAISARERFELITAFHVVEHLPDPRATLQQLATLLIPGGEIVIEIPSADDALLSLYQCEPFANFTYWSQHLFLFTPATLAQLVKQAGLTLRWVKQVQRYPLSNHLYWLAYGQPGGHKIWNFLDTPSLHEAYSDQLAAIGKCDTLMAGIQAV